MSEIKNTNELVKEIYDVVVEGGGISEDILYIKNKVDIIEGDVESQSTGLSTIKSDTSSIKSDIEDQTNGLSAIKTDTSSIKSSVGDQSNGLAAIKSDTASIKSDLEDPTTGIVETNGEVKSIKNVIESYSGGVGIVSEISRGKTIISDAINTKGGSTHPYDSYSTLATAIENIPGPGVIDSTGVTSIDNLSVPFLSWLFTSSGRNSQSRNIDTINDNTITNITRDSAFSDCPTLTSVTMSAVTEINAKKIFLVDGGRSNLSSISFPALQTIDKGGDTAFYSCTRLTSVNMPELISIYGNNVFDSCTSLTEISLPKLKVIGSGNNMFGYGKHLFSNCTSLQRASLPKLSYIGMAGSVYSGNATFYGCSKLEYIELGRLTSFPFDASDGMFGSSDTMPKLRTIKLNLGPNGEKTGVSLNFRQWKAANVIAEGQSGINELNQNLYNDLLTKLEDRTGLTACTLVIGWLSNVSQSNIDYATSKGWTLSN